MRKNIERECGFGASNVEISHVANGTYAGAPIENLSTMTYVGPLGKIASYIPFVEKSAFFAQFSTFEFITQYQVINVTAAISQGNTAIPNIPIDPDAVKCFDEFHEKYGKYITAAQSIK